MARPRKSRREQGPPLDSVSHRLDGNGPIDPRAFGLVKAAYGVSETLDLLSIGRTSLYAAVKRGELTRVKLGKRTLFRAIDLAAFLMTLHRSSDKQGRRRGGHEADA
jgi:hypothetical protein